MINDDWSKKKSHFREKYLVLSYFKNATKKKFMVWLPAELSLSFLNRNLQNANLTSLSQNAFSGVPKMEEL